MADALATLELVWPSREYLPGYVAALERGWHADTRRADVASREELEDIARDADAFLEHLVDFEAKGPPVTLPDGSTVPRLPGFVRWMWDGDFCGSIGFRWQPGTTDLPPTCLGHIGYSVVPWKQQRGYATQALRIMLEHPRAMRMSFVELTADLDNAPSQRVITANGGVLVRRFQYPPQHGERNGHQYRIQL